MMPAPSLLKAKNVMAAIDVFISHSSQDAAIAKALIDLLRISLGIPSEKIRCTSVDGYRLPVGASTEQQLRNDLSFPPSYIKLLGGRCLSHVDTEGGANLRP